MGKSESLFRNIEPKVLRTLESVQVTYDPVKDLFPDSTQRITFWVPWFLFPGGQSYIKHCEFDGYLKYVGIDESIPGEPQVSMEIVKDAN